MAKTSVARRLAVCACLFGAAKAGAEAQLVGIVPNLGEGLSGLSVYEGGTRFTAIGDRGALLHGVITREDGAPVAAQITQRHMLRDAQGAPSGDAEGLARAADGALWVSYEGSPQALRRHSPLGVEAERFPAPPGFEALHFNHGGEALAIGRDGALYMLPEVGGQVPVWQFRVGAWHHVLSLGITPGFQPAGADIGPDGALYVLERKFLGLNFATRIIRVPLDGSGSDLVLATDPGDHDNLEGLSVWRDEDGRLRATMVADNNGIGLLEGGLVEYVLDP